MDIVDAEGRELHLSSAENEELFWAARGAGPGRCFVFLLIALNCGTNAEYLFL